MNCNSFESYKKNSDPYAQRVCCPNMKREAKKWAHLKYGKKKLCVKTCCNRCLDVIQTSINKENGKFRINKKMILEKEISDAISPF